MRRLATLGLLVIALAGCKPADVPPRPPLIPAGATPTVTAEPTGLDIPPIGVHVTSIARLELDEAGAMEIPKDPAVVGWYPLGPAPGERGPAVLTGHVNYGGVPGVFARLHELKTGDEITVLRTDRSTVAFVVYAVDQYAKDAFPTDAVFGDTAVPVLRLITCGGELDTTAHSYRDNIVVSARLKA